MSYQRPEHLHPAELDRERAHHAQLKIEEIVNNERINNNEAKSWIEKLPALIQTNGLGQALSFYKSRTSVPSAPAIYRIMGDWLKAQFGFKEEDVLSWLTQNATPEQYRHAQAEAQAYLRWLKQLAKAYLKKTD